MAHEGIDKEENYGHGVKPEVVIGYQNHGLIFFPHKKKKVICKNYKPILMVLGKDIHLNEVIMTN